MRPLYFTILALSFFTFHNCTAQVSQPTQPTSGPGGSNYTYADVTQYDYATNGSGEDFWLYEPANPTPDSANLVVFIHGLGETNPKLYGAFIKHLVRKGNIVIFPRYQKDLLSVTSTFNDSCARGIQKALDTLQMPGHVKPRLYNYFICGHSVGGILTANMTELYAQYGLPKPLASFSMEPGASLLTGILLNDYSTFPADVKYLVLIASQDIVVGTSVGAQLYNQTTAVPTSHKNLVELFPDNHGSPSVDATHMDPLASDAAFDNGESNTFTQLSGSGPVDVVDYYCTWKLMDALMDCALSGSNCNVAFGDTPEQKSMGNWSDGTPVTPLVITPSSANGINNVSNDLKTVVYPNPSNTNWTLQTAGFTGSLTLQLSDITGRVLLSKQVSQSNITIKNNYGPGMYFYILKNDSDKVVAEGRLVGR